MLRGIVMAAFGVAGLIAKADEKKFVYIDLQPKAQKNLSDPLHRETSVGNNLAELPRGEQTLEGVKFKVGERLIQLGCKLLPDNPMKVKGIQVGKTIEKLHILHATGFGGGMEGDPTYVADDTLIGQYDITYEDKTTETIQIVYGKDVRDWWYREGAKDTTRSKVAWKGSNEYAKNADAMIRLYLSTWKNPKPDKKVISIDFSSANTIAAPFCVAMTAEVK